ncbi:MAG TPA: hypothetical protein DCE41_26045 [Cytophagales bacterium]|nr:hypothetical protein [Cytophagales bacterium]
MRDKLTLLFFTMLPLVGWSQPPAPVVGDSWQGSLRFVEDSVWVGYPTPVVLTVRYPQDWQVLLPDSAASFGPFEYDRHDYFPTQTQAGISFDSAVYYLATFEVDEVQAVSLPFQVISANDTATFWLGTDSIGFWDVVVPMPDTLNFQTGELLVVLDKEFNTPYATVIFIVVAVLLVVLSLLFAKPLKHWWKRQRLQRQHEKWLERLDQLTGALATGEGRGTVPEQWINHWKKYLEQLEGRPYTKMTTRELAGFPEAKDFLNALKQFDRAIYGRRITPELPQEAARLRGYAVGRYEERLQHLDQ